MEAKGIARQLEAGFNRVALHMHFYFSHKLWKSFFDQIIVNKTQIDMIKDLLRTSSP
jgi:hypothetical protein